MDVYVRNPMTGEKKKLAHSGQYVTASPMSANTIRHVSPA